MIAAYQAAKAALEECEEPPMRANSSGQEWVAKAQIIYFRSLIEVEHAA
jgi:hypothetical protein